MDALSFKTVSVNNFTVKREWVIVDAEGQHIGRLASKIAKRIRGKHKPDFTPHINCGDHVIVINAEKIQLTGNKWENKLYVCFTGYPGGQKITTAQEEFYKDPRRLIEKAVKGMLPKNRLGSQLYKNLYVYEGGKHEHEAQKPKVLKIDDIF
ncbi:MAG: 50S ribosomal protein L13 [Flavobacteriales bacterium Tduv]